MRTGLNSFPILWSIWICPSYPPFFSCTGLCSVSSLPVAQFQVFNPPSAPSRNLSTHSCPQTLFVCLSLNLFALSPSPSPFPLYPHHLLLSSALYTLVCWHVLCLSSLWRLFRLLIKDRSPPQQKGSALPLNKQFISLLFFSPHLPSTPPCLPLHPTPLLCVFSLLAKGEICALAMFFFHVITMLWNRLTEDKEGGERGMKRSRRREKKRQQVIVATLAFREDRQSLSVICQSVGQSSCLYPCADFDYIVHWDTCSPSHLSILSSQHCSKLLQAPVVCALR